MEYQEIDHLLLNVNKGPGQAGVPGSDPPVFPRPGDSVMVSASNGKLISIQIHQVHSDSLVCKGKTMEQIQDEADRKFVESGSHVSFSYKKIAGIHRL